MEAIRRLIDSFETWWVVAMVTIVLRPKVLPSLDKLSGDSGSDALSLQFSCLYQKEAVAIMPAAKMKTLVCCSQDLDFTYHF